MIRKLRVRTPLSIRRPMRARRAVAVDTPAEYSKEARILRALHAAAIVTGLIAVATLVVGLAVIR